MVFGGLARAQGTTYDAPTSIGGVGWVNTSHLWLPDDVDIIRGAIVQYSTWFDPSWQALARAHGFALIIIDNYYFDTIGSGDGQNFLNDLAWYANASGHSEITNLPFVFTGWSKGGQVAEAFNEWIPGRTISFIANKGGYYHSRPSYYHTAAALKTPAIVVAGELDADYRITAITSLFETNRPSGAPWALAFEENSPHQEGNVNGMFFTLFDHAIRARYPAGVTPLSGPVALLDLSETNGWLAAEPTVGNGLSGSVYPYADYPGPGAKTHACWLMDADVANLYRGFATYSPAVTVTAVGGPVYAAGQTIQFNVVVDSVAFPGWVSADVYDGAVKLGTVTHGGATSVSAVRPWGGRGVTAIARDAAGNERTSIPQPFVVSNAVALTNSVATPVHQTSADLNATFSPAWGSYAITACWGTVNGGSTVANWQHSAVVGTWSGGDPVSISYTATGLGSATTYYFAFRASNALKQVWATNVLNFTTDATTPNHAPTSTGGSVSLNGDTVKTFAATDFPFADVDAGDTLGAIQVTSLPTHGTLKLSGTPLTITPGAVIPGANIGTLTYTPNTGYIGPDSFKFRVRDATAFSADATMAITVKATILVVNGSFETSGAGSGGPWARFGSPWPVTGLPSIYQQVQAVSGGFFTSAVSGGGTWIALLSVDDVPQSSPLVQNLGASVSAGNTLVVTFWLGRDKTNPGAQGVAYFDVAGTRYPMTFDTTLLPADSWQSYTLTQTITHAGNLSLGFYSTSPRQSWGDPHSWLDKISDVTVTNVPVPGSYAGWAAANGAGSQTMEQDHDHDGVPNGIEYFLGGNANTTGFTALPGVVKASNGTLSVTWTKAAAGYTGVYGTDYVVQSSTTLTGTWMDEPATGGGVTVTGNEVKHTFPSGSFQKFARLKVMGPP